MYKQQKENRKLCTWRKGI